jgi:hypothetical protein
MFGYTQPRAPGGTTTCHSASRTAARGDARPPSDTDCGPFYRPSAFQSDSHLGYFRLSAVWVIYLESPDAVRAARGDFDALGQHLLRDATFVLVL